MSGPEQETAHQPQRGHLPPTSSGVHAHDNLLLEFSSQVSQDFIQFLQRFFPLCHSVLPFEVPFSPSKDCFTDFASECKSSFFRSIVDFGTDLLRFDKLSRALSQSQIRAAECSTSLYAFKASLVSVKKNFSFWKAVCADECALLRLAASQLASQKVALNHDLSIMKNLYLKERDASIAARDQSAHEKLSLIQERDRLAIKVVQLSKDNQLLQFILESSKFHRFLSFKGNSDVILENSHVDLESEFNLRGNLQNLISTQSQLNVVCEVDQALAASQRCITDQREHVVRLKLALDHEKALHSQTASKLTHAEISIGQLKFQLHESNAKLSRAVLDSHSMSEKNLHLQSHMDELEFRLKHAISQIQALTSERSQLQEDKFVATTDLRNFQAHFEALEVKLQIYESSHFSIETLVIEKATLEKELEEFEISAQRQIDVWKGAAKSAKNDADELKIRLDNRVLENKLLLLSLDNKV
jgi:hypothetical protein